MAINKERLSPEELEELLDALDDGFKVPAFTYSNDDDIEYVDFADPGLYPQGLLKHKHHRPKKVEYTGAEDIWLSHTPININLDKLAAFFDKRASVVARLQDEALEQYYNEGHTDYELGSFFLRIFPPYTIGWYEQHISFGISSLREHVTEEVQFDEGFLAAGMNVGRMIEQYYWRFAHEADAVSGGKHRHNTALGRAETAREKQKETQPNIAEMKRLIANGHSVTRAADIAFKNGFGSSGEANRRLYHRAINRKL